LAKTKAFAKFYDPSRSSAVLAVPLLLVVALEWHSSGGIISTSIVPHCAVRYLLIELSGTLLDWTTVPQLYCTVPSAALDHPHEMVYAGGVDADPTIRS